MRPIFRADSPIVAKIHEHFSQPRSGAAPRRARSTPRRAAVASRDHIAHLLTAAFWASLNREEIWTTKLSLAYFVDGNPGCSFTFAHPLALLPKSLAKVAPAVERPGIHLVVAPDEAGELFVWGASLMLPARCLVVEVTRPGELVVKHPHAGPFSKFVNVAVIAGEDAKLVVEAESRTLECRALLASLLEDVLASPGASRRHPAGVFVDLALSMRAHGRGGTLLIVPSGDVRWRESIRTPLTYAAREPFEELRLHAHSSATERRSDRSKRTIEAVAGLTAVDGATVMTEGLDVLAFGAKIVRRAGAPLVESVVVSEPIADNVPTLEVPSVLGGTRHLSAAQFVHDQREALALVASQDGRFTVFAWSTCDAAVHARRIDVLLL